MGIGLTMPGPSHSGSGSRAHRAAVVSNCRRLVDTSSRSRIRSSGARVRCRLSSPNGSTSRVSPSCCWWSDSVCDSLVSCATSPVSWSPWFRIRSLTCVSDDDRRVRASPICWPWALKSAVRPVVLDAMESIVDFRSTSSASSRSTLASTALMSPLPSASTSVAWLTWVIASRIAGPWPSSESAPTRISSPSPPGAPPCGPRALSRVSSEPVSSSHLIGECVRCNGIDAPSASFGPPV